MKFFAFCLFAFLANEGAASSRGIKTRKDIKATEDLEIEKLHGRWFSAYSNMAAKFLLKLQDAYCATLDIYEYSEGESFLFVEAMQVESGSISWSGEGHVLDKKNPGELHMLNEGLEGLQKINMKFDEETEPNFLILSVGHEEENQYSYFIATDPLGMSLSVVVKDKDSLDKYDREIKNKLEKFGFISDEIKPIMSRQENCQYRKDEPPFLDDFDIEHFTGRYFMVLLNPFVMLMNRFMFHAKCIALDITQKDKISLDVIRSKTDFITGRIEEEREELICKPHIPGQLLIKGKTSAAGLKMSILKTGKILKDQYEYIIATDQSRLGLVVLSPDSEILQSKREEIHNFLKEKGYDSYLSGTREVDHEKCQYRPKEDMKSTTQNWEYIRFRGVMAY